MPKPPSEGAIVGSNDAGRQGNAPGRGGANLGGSGSFIGGSKSTAGSSAELIRSGTLAMLGLKVSPPSEPKVVQDTPEALDAEMEQSRIVKLRGYVPPPSPGHAPKYPDGLQGILDQIKREKEVSQQEQRRNDPEPWEPGGLGEQDCEEPRDPPGRAGRKHQFDGIFQALGVRLSKDLRSATCRHNPHGGLVVSRMPIVRKPSGRYFEVCIEEMDKTRWEDGLGIGLASLEPREVTDKLKNQKGLVQAYANELLPESWLVGYDGRAVFRGITRYIGGREAHMLWPNNRQPGVVEASKIWRPSDLRPGDVLGFLATPQASIMLFVNDELVYHMRDTGIPWNNSKLRACLDLDGCTKSVRMLEVESPSTRVLHLLARLHAKELGRSALQSDAEEPIALDNVYKKAQERLVNEYHYPEELISTLPGYDSNFANAPNLAVDAEYAAICKLNSWCRVSVAFFGKGQVDPKKVTEEIYDGPVRWSQIREWDWRFRRLHQTFGPAQACLMADVVQWFKTRHVEFDADVLTNDVLTVTQQAGEEVEAKEAKQRQDELERAKIMWDAAELLAPVPSPKSPRSPEPLASKAARPPPPMRLTDVGQALQALTAS